MMFQNLLSLIKPIRVSNAVAAGTTTINATAVDLIDFAGVLFLAALGTITSTGVPAMKLQHSDDNSTFADVEASLQTYDDTAGNKFMVAELRSPLKRYVRAVITRTTANVVVDGVFAFPYGSTLGPPSIDSTQLGSTKVILNQRNTGTA